MRLKVLAERRNKKVLSPSKQKRLKMIGLMK